MKEIKVDMESAQIRHAQDFIEYIESAKCMFGSLPARVKAHLDLAIDEAEKHKQAIEALPISDARASAATRA